MKYTALGEDLVTYISSTWFRLVLSVIIITTPLSPQAVYFIQTGGSAVAEEATES